MASPASQPEPAATLATFFARNHKQDHKPRKQKQKKQQKRNPNSNPATSKNPPPSLLSLLSLPTKPPPLSTITQHLVRLHSLIRQLSRLATSALLPTCHLHIAECRYLSHIVRDAHSSPLFSTHLHALLSTHPTLILNALLAIYAAELINRRRQPLSRHRPPSYRHAHFPRDCARLVPSLALSIGAQFRTRQGNQRLAAVSARELRERGWFEPLLAVVELAVVLAEEIRLFDEAEDAGRRIRPEFPGKGSEIDRERMRVRGRDGGAGSGDDRVMFTVLPGWYVQKENGERETLVKASVAVWRGLER